MNYRFNFTKHKKIYLTVSGTIILIGIISLLVFGMNLGVDFVSGSRIEVHLTDTFSEQDISELIDKTAEEAKLQGIENVNLKASSITTSGNDNQIAVIRFDETIDSDILPILKDVFRAEYGEDVDIAESTVDPVIGRETALKAIYAVIAASIGIILYVTIRFEYRFALTAIAALVYDAMFVITIFAVLRLEVDLTFVAAVLTIIGYSINDTIVIFDRIRENLKYAKIKTKADIEDVVNYSLNQTLARSINTSLTVIFAAFALFLLGGEGIRLFSLALLLGVFSGAYSSIFISSQLWTMWKSRDVEKNRFKTQPE